MNKPLETKSSVNADAVSRLAEATTPRLWVAGPVAELRAAAATGLPGALVTNPTVVAQWNATDERTVETIAAGLAEQTGLPLYLQLRGPDRAAFVRQAGQLRAAHPLLLPKLPATADGFAACRDLQCMPVLVTGVASLAQVFAAQAAGARFICPYLARLRDAGVEVASFFEQARQLIAQFSQPMELVPASVRTVEDMELALRHGASGVIVFTGLFADLAKHSLTEQALRGFEADWLKIRTQLK